MRLPERLEAEGLVAHAPTAHLLHPFIDEIAERGLLGARQEDDALPLRFAHLGGDPLQRPVPVDVLELPARVPHHWVRDTIRVVESLERRLPTRAEPPAIDRGVRIALELDGPSLTHAHAHTASRRTFAAGRGVIRRGTRYLVFGLH